MTDQERLLVERLEAAITETHRVDADITLIRDTIVRWGKVLEGNGESGLAERLGRFEERLADIETNTNDNRQAINRLLWTLLTALGTAVGALMAALHAMG